jgi:hypothetical protein
MRTLLVATALLAPGCAVIPQGEPAVWYRTPVTRDSNDKILAAMDLVLASRGLQVETRDPSLVKVVSNWRSQLRAVRYEGYRERVTMQVETNPKGERVIAVMVDREVNTEEHKTLSESEAEWVPAGGNNDAARGFVQLLRMKLKLEGAGMDD